MPSILSLLQPRWPWRNPSMSLGDLPTELILEIANHLSDVDRLVLALTCKSLMNILDGSKSLQSSTKFKHPATYSCPPEFNVRIHPLNGPRWVLLTRLQDSTWRLCHCCLRLHRSDQFHWLQRRNVDWMRTCNFGRRAGVVRLCPCLEITFGDKINLIRFMQKAASTPYRTDGVYKLHDVVILGAPDGQVHHRCGCTYNSGRVEVQRRLRIFLEKRQDPDGSVEKHENDPYGGGTSQKRADSFDFVVETDFTVKGTIFDLPALLCPHRRIADQNRQISSRQGPFCANGLIQVITDTYRVFVSDKAVECPYCKTRVFNARWSDDLYCFTTRRNFGNVNNLANSMWYRQTENVWESTSEPEPWKLNYRHCWNDI